MTVKDFWLIAHLVVWLLIAPVLALLFTDSMDLISLGLTWLVAGGVCEAVLLAFWWLAARRRT